MRRLAALEVLIADEAPLATEKAPIQLELPESVDETKSERAKEIIRSSKRGVKPRDITNGLLKQGVEVGAGFASNLLWRLKHKTKEVVVYRGRYFWKGMEPTAQRAPEGTP